MNKMFRRLLLVSLLGIAPLVLAQSSTDDPCSPAWKGEKEKRVRPAITVPCMRVGNSDCLTRTPQAEVPEVRSNGTPNTPAPPCPERLVSQSTTQSQPKTQTPDAPAPQPDAGQQPSQPAAQPAPAKPAAQPDPSDPASRPDWKPADTDQGYEKKTMGQRMKDQVNSPVCVNGHCFGGKKSGDKGDKDEAQGPGPSQKPPRSDEQTRSLNDDGESSSRSAIGDISPPRDDARNHPESSTGDEPAADVSEMKKWDPHRAAKNVEVGDFYFDKKNYAAAKSRYEEALEYKDNYAEAMYKLAVSDEKLEHPDEARKYYELYLKTLPQGDYAQASRDALARLGDKAAKKTQ